MGGVIALGSTGLNETVWARGLGGSDGRQANRPKRRHKPVEMNMNTTSMNSNYLATGCIALALLVGAVGLARQSSTTTGSDVVESSAPAQAPRAHRWTREATGHTFIIADAGRAAFSHRRSSGTASDVAFVRAAPGWRNAQTLASLESL
jgi:hypothetical protein